MAAPQKITRRKSLTLEEKLEIVNKYENGTQNHKLCKEYDCNSSTISTILKMKDKLKIHYKELTDLNSNTKRKRVCKPEFEKLEKAVYAWLRQKRTIGETVSSLLLQEKARIFYITMKEQGQIPENIPEFKASDGWLSNFKDRYNLRTIQPKGEKASADSAASEIFVDEFNKFINENNYDVDNIYNADETGLLYRTLPDKTLVLSNEKEVAAHKPLKERLTIMVCANASGTHRLPLLVIGKSAKPRCFKNNQELPLNYTNQKKAWMDSKIFIHWFKDIFLKNIRELKPDAKILLLLDNAPTHPSAEELNAIDSKCTVVYLPPNVTSLIQPMDQGVISAMKRRYKTGFLREVLACNHTSNCAFIQFVKKWTVLDSMNVLRDAWISLTSNTLKNSWKKLINSASLDTGLTQLNIDMSLSNNELLDLIHRVPGGSVCSTEDVSNWLEKEQEVNLPTFKVLSDEEILNAHAGLNLTVLNENETEDSCDESGELEETAHDLPSQTLILNSAQCIVNWSREISEFSEEERLIFIKARDIALSLL